LIQEAKELIDIGLPIIPLCSHNHEGMSAKHIERCKKAGKTPIIKEWSTHSVTTEADLKEWISSFKAFNIGLPLGDASGYCGIDVDGDEGVKLLMDMSKGDLPSTWEFTTGAGSRLLYCIPAGMKTKKFKQSGSGEHEECALLCNGQQTVLPPSIHFTGKVYTWIEGHSPWDIDCALAPQWLQDKIRLTDVPTTYGSNMSLDLTEMAAPKNVVPMDLDDEFSPEEMQYDLPPNVKLMNKTVKGQVGKSGHKIVVDDELLAARIPEGDRDNTMTAIVGHYCANRDLRRFGKELIMQICMKHNLEHCDPPLDEQAIRDKVEYFFSAEGMKDASFKNKGKGGKVQFEPSKMAVIVLQHLKEQGIYLHFDQLSKIYYYTTADKGPWKSAKSYALIQSWIRSVLISPEYGDPAWDKRAYIEETRMALEESFTVAYKEVDDFDLGAHATELCDFIVVNNGMVDWRNKLLVDWDPEIHTTVSFDINYDPTAECPRFEKYLKDWLPDDSVRSVMQEYLGYCLIPNTNFRKALFLYGKGKNGKSMLIEFLQKMFGSCASNLSYDGLFTRFGPANLKDKLVNIFDDTTVSFSKETSIAKNLIAGGQISAEFKGHDLFSFTNVARLIYSSQETPRTSDNTVAWYERWFFVKFPNSFRASNKVKFEIQQALEEEKAGIFNWMIDGLIRLTQNDGFTPSPELDLYSNQYRDQNDNVTQFVHAICKNSPDSKISVAQLYDVYRVWIESEQLRPLSKKVFSQRISDMGFEKVKTSINAKTGVTAFKGLDFDILSEDYQEHLLEINIALNGR
jgi:P4 family phage/plasmid primase-like protien